MKEQDKKISVIVPVYNVEKYIDRCVESIRNQTYKNLEIILVDDGAKDRSGEICDSYAKKDNRVKVIHKVNGGLSDARNAGIQVASGDYIAFIDSDDYIAATMYEDMLGALEHTGSDIALCDFLRVYEGKELENTPSATEPETKQYQKLEFQHVYFDDKKKQVLFTAAWNKLYPRKYVEGFLFPVGKIHEDEFTSFELLHKAEKIVVVEKPLYYYLQRDNSIMGSGFSQKSFDLLEAFQYRIQYYDEQAQEELLKKMLSHYMHALAFLHIKIKESKNQQYFSIEKQRIAEYGKKYQEMKGNYKFSFGTNVEVWLFCKCTKLYFEMWNIYRKVTVK